MPSFDTDVFPLIQARCQKCHRPVEPRQPDLSSYASIYAVRTSILTQVYSCRMPADGQLTADERAILLDWLVCGAPP